MGVVLQRGYEDRREPVSKSDGSNESVESERRLGSLGAMEAECARKLLCVWCGWVTAFLSIA